MCLGILLVRDLLLRLCPTPFSYGWSPNIHLNRIWPAPESYHKPFFRPKGHRPSGRGAQMMENYSSTLNYTKPFVQFLGRANTPLASPWLEGATTFIRHQPKSWVWTVTNLESSVRCQPRAYCTKEALFTDSALSLSTRRINLGCKGKASVENIIWWLEHERHTMAQASRG